jgi:myotubularin-related protein 1/2
LQSSFSDYLKKTTNIGDSKIDVHVYDMRPKKAAIGNKFKGKGYESTEFYQNISMHFCDIPNIHSVRDSYKDLIKLLSV